MRGAFGEIGDMRLHVMAAITIADDLADARRRVGGLEKEIEKLKLIASAGSERSSEAEGKLAEAVHKNGRAHRTPREGAEPGGWGVKRIAACSPPPCGEKLEAGV